MKFRFMKLSEGYSVLSKDRLRMHGYVFCMAENKWMNNHSSTVYQTRKLAAEALIK